MTSAEYIDIWNPARRKLQDLYNLDKLLFWSDFLSNILNMPKDEIVRINGFNEPSRPALPDDLKNLLILISDSPHAMTIIKAYKIRNGYT